MTRLFLSALLFLNTLFGFAQEKNDYLRQINSSELSRAQSLISDFAHTFYTETDGTLWQQDIQVHEKRGFIIYKLRPAKDSLLENWAITQQIPLLRIDTIYQDYKDTSVTLGSNHAFVQVFSDNKNFSQSSLNFHARIQWVRNMSGQLWEGIRFCKKQKLKNLTARETVREAVLQYLIKEQYPTNLIHRLLADNSLYVGKCNICNGTKDAFSDYVYAIKNTNSLQSELSTGLRSDNRDTKMRALETLVRNAVDEFYYQNNFSKDEVQNSQAIISAERKKSMGIAGGKKCASCDGACNKDGL